MNFKCVPVIATDGFKFYRTVARRVFGAACLYGQVIKTRRNDRIVRVKRRIGTGAAWRWEQAWRNAEDSRKLNTSYVERLNLTIRQGSAYLFRRTICQARRKQRLDDHLELLRCHYNFLRPHRALKFGRQVRTPAMQAGLTRWRMTFRDIFSSISFVCLFRKIQFVFAYRASSVPIDDLRLSGAALQRSIAEAPKWVYILSRRAAKKLIPAKMHIPVSTEGGFS